MDMKTICETAATDGQRPAADGHFDAIMQLQGVEEFKEAVRRVRKFQENKERYAVLDARLPNYLWLARRGGGITTCANAFAEYLSAAKTIEFSGIVKYFKFIPAYTPPEAYFSELARLNNTLTEIAGHHRHFKGIACIIIDDWLEHAHEVHFKNLLYFCESIGDRVMTIFCAHTYDKRTVETVESTITSYMRCETVSLRFPDVGELITFIEEKYFAKHRFALAEDARTLLTESVAEIVTGRNFNGFKTIRQLASDIIYGLLASEVGGDAISADRLCRFSKDSAYIRRIKAFRGNKVMGFGAQKEECLK